MAKYFDLELGDCIDIGDGAVTITVAKKSGRSGRYKFRLKVESEVTTPVVRRTAERIGACLNQSVGITPLSER